MSSINPETSVSIAIGIVKFRTVSADSIDVFYRGAGSTSKPNIVLLHGFPSSSLHFRNFMPLLAEKFHGVAPDLPGFGFTSVPETCAYEYSFANFAITIGALLSKINIKKFSIYVFDYGAPIGLRIALRNPDKYRIIGRVVASPIARL